MGGRGFKELESFNLALLAKKISRLITKTESLVGKNLKEKYFKHEEVLEARVKSNSSSIWKSLIAAREVLKARLRWRVGNGSKIKIWSDQWLPNTST